MASTHSEAPSKKPGTVPSGEKRGDCLEQTEMGKEGETTQASGPRFCPHACAPAEPFCWPRNKLCHSGDLNLGSVFAGLKLNSSTMLHRKNIALPKPKLISHNSSLK